jgi:GntR family transcriptional regulator
LNGAVGREVKIDGPGELEFIGGASRAHRARDALLRAILRHHFPEGRLPPEGELARRLGVSRTTVRTALHSLEAHGVLKRTPGQGTSVHERMSPSVVALHRLIGLGDLIREQGHEVSYLPSMTTIDEPGPEVVEALALEPGTECYEIQRVLFPTASFVGELEFDDATGASSPFEIDGNLFVEPIDHAVVQLVPRAAGDELVEKLGLAPSQPCILLREVFYSESGTALGFSAIHVNDRFVRFELIRRKERP